MPKLFTILIKFVLPVALIAIGFRLHVLLGFALAAVCLAFAFYRGKTGFYAYLGHRSYQNGKRQEALLWMEKAAARSDCRASYLIGYGYLLLKAGRLEKAAEVLDRARSMPLSREERMNAEANYALLLWRQGKLDEAIATLEEVHEDIKNTNVYGSLGYFYIAKGDLDKALSFNREAYEYNDSSPVILDNLGQTLYLRGETEEALKLYEKLYGMSPKFPEAYYNYGLVLEAAGRRADAAEMLKRALEQPFSMLNTVTKEEIEGKLAKLSAVSAGQGGAEERAPAQA